MRIVTSHQMKTAEAAAAADGMSYLRLMENAGSACANWMLRHFSLAHSGARVCVVCGKGKNGGDGYVIARKLCEAECEVTVVQTERDLFGDEAEMCSRLSGLPLRIVRPFAEGFDPAALFARQQYLVDALFGTGFRGAADAKTAGLMDAMNASCAKRISIDLPSGIECGSAAIHGAYVHADYTLAIAAYKPLHVVQPAADCCGKKRVLSIGLEEAHFAQSDAEGLYTLSLPELQAQLLPRGPLAHKGDFGRVLSICGSRNMQGAAVLAANAALRMGAGLVTAAFPESAYAAVAPKLCEPLLLPLPENGAGMLSVKALDALLAAAEQADAVLLGCGLGLCADTREIVREILRHCRKTLILDADGINAVAADINILKESPAQLILTPHPGEMARLCGAVPDADYTTRINLARNFAQEYGVTLVLKGANTVVASAGESRVYLNATGNAGLATGGSGDMLAGMMVSLAAQNVHSSAPLSAQAVAAAAVYLHGAAGDSAAQRLSKRSLLPTDCLADLAELLREFD